MNGRSHAVTSFALGVAAGTMYFSLGPATGARAAAAIGGLFAVYAGGLYPDIDNDSSIIASSVLDNYNGESDAGGDKFSISAFKHRGFFHTPIAAVMASLPAILAYLLLSHFFEGDFSWLLLLGAGFAAGCIWHLVLDTFTPMGVMWLYPIRTRISIPICRSYVFQPSPDSSERLYRPSLYERIIRFLSTCGFIIVAIHFWAECLVKMSGK